MGICVQCTAPGRSSPLLSSQKTTNRAEVDLQLETQQKNSVMHAEALEMVMLVLAVIAGILLLRGDTFIFSIGRGMVWQERGPRRAFGFGQ